MKTNKGNKHNLKSKGNYKKYYWIFSVLALLTISVVAIATTTITDSFINANNIATENLNVSNSLNIANGAVVGNSALT